MSTSLAEAFAKVRYQLYMLLTSWSVSSRDLASSVVGARGDTTTVRGEAVMAGHGAASPSCVVSILYTVSRAELEMVPGGAPSVQWLRTRDAAARPRPADTGD